MAVTIDGTTGVSLVQDATITDDKLSLTANSQEIKDALNASGDAPISACRAWVNFNGTGTVAIRASFNVSSITDNGTGRYTVNFTTAMPDADYGVQVTGTYATGTGTNIGSSAGAVAINVSSFTSGTSYSATYSSKTTGAVALYFTASYDAFDANVAIFR